jgi:hypothetical protein
VESWRTESIPPPVAGAAAAHGLGGPVTRASTNRLTPTRSYLLFGTALMTSFLSSVAVYSLGLPTGLLGPIVLVAVLGCVARAGWLLVARQTLHLFERGAVIENRRPADLEVHPWTAMLPYERYQRRTPSRNSPHHLVLTIKVAGRVVFSCADETAGRLADVISAVELSRARTLLAAGRPVDYGIVVVTPQVFRVGELSVPWTEVTGMQAGRDYLRLDRSAGLPVPLPRDRTPHQRTLIALGEQLSVGARRAGRF